MFITLHLQISLYCDKLRVCVKAGTEAKWGGEVLAAGSKV